ncbi:MAG: DUF4331 domain-containing protein [Candidatus Eremiobacteraeota bacterium]|nr:DUF4331 domain-containing protein [Candidatus Eremiobacteraeota bacterium]
MIRILARLTGVGFTVFALAGALFLYANHVARGSDHQDSPLTTQRPGADISDMYVFPSATNSKNVVLAMNVHPIIPAGQGTRTFFDPGVVYQYKIDNTGDYVEDTVVQFKASGVGANQKIAVFLGKPQIAGREEFFTTPVGTVNYNTITRFANNQVAVFAGPRQDSFFFDLAQFFKIIPDRNAQYHPPFSSGPPPPTAHSFRGFHSPTSCDTSAAQDFLGALDLNVLSLVIEVPRSMIARSGVPNKVNIWSTTAIQLPNKGSGYYQVERFARPAEKEVFTSYDSHGQLNISIPRDGDAEFARMIYAFTTQVAHRSPAIATVLAKVLTPYVMKVDLAQPGPAAYLGVETNGATGGKFGGRKLQDDVIDTSLKAIFGNTIPALHLAPEDGHESPCLETDNVGPGLHQFHNYFPYLGNPN